ncbi:MAG: peptidoglycan-binding protein [bacterium]|nr:peptidoglycan-binding protein [bacterium]
MLVQAGSLSVGTTTIGILASTTISSVTGATSTVTIRGDFVLAAGARYTAPTNSTTTINGTTGLTTFYATSTPSFGYLVFGGASGGANTGTTNLQTSVTIANRLSIAAGRILNAEGATITLSGSNSNSSTFPLEVTGTFTSATSTITYSGTGATTVASTTYATVNWNGATTYTLGGATTVSTAGTVASGTTLAVSTFTLTATGSTWTNSGTVTEGTGGKIVKASASQFDNGSGTAKSAFSGDDRNTVYVRVTDTSLNLLAATAETQTVTITAKSMISDTETVTLTETTVTSGIFSGGVTFGMSGTNVGSQLDYQGPGTLSFAFTDSQDSSDTGSGSGTFTGTAPGGGGGGGATVVVTTTTTTTTTATTTAATTIPIVTTTPTATAASTLESVQSKVTSVIAKIAALPTNPTVSDLASIQAEITAILLELQTIQTAAQPTPQGVALGFNFVRPLALGLRHTDVSNLQKALKTDSSIYSEGLVTGYFGPATLRAVQKFQEKYGLASSGVPGYGNVGPKTRIKLNELYGSK